MKISYVVLYVTDPIACLKFWTEQIGMIKKDQKQAGDFTITKVGFADQEFSFELVPLKLMEQNPSGLDLATPSIALSVKDLPSVHAEFSAKGIQVSEISQHSGVESFGFCDNEGRWFAMIKD